MSVKVKGKNGKSTGSRGRLCTNSCPVADLWSNCAELHDKWSNGWLCKVRARIVFIELECIYFTWLKRVKAD